MWAGLRFKVPGRLSAAMRVIHIRIDADNTTDEAGKKNIFNDFHNTFLTVVFC